MEDVWRKFLLAISLLIGYFLLLWLPWRSSAKEVEGKRQDGNEEVGGRTIDRMKSKQKQQLKVAYLLNWINLGSDFLNHLLDTQQTMVVAIGRFNLVQISVGEIKLARESGNG